MKARLLKARLSRTTTERLWAIGVVCFGCGLGGCTTTVVLTVMHQPTLTPVTVFNATALVVGFILAWWAA